MTADALFFNGVNGRNGAYLYKPLALDDLERSLGSPIDDDHAAELRYARESGEPHFGLRHGLDAEALADAGWGVVVPAGNARAVVDALAPLLVHRRSEAGERYYEFELVPGASKQAFLAQHGMGPGVTNPAKVPYYLLLAGGPDEISYRFQYELDAQYAVGRVAFDTLDEYRSYAQTVVTAETAATHSPRSIRLFGPHRAADRASTLSATQLVKPLAAALAADPSGWSVEAIVGVGATKERLSGLLCGKEAPALLFTAGHGIGFESGDPRRREEQGALVVQDWPGPRAGIREEHYLSGGDIPCDQPVRARIVFSFACFGAGTPETATKPAFVARLPQRLLGNPEGGALAYVGHVDRARGYSFVWPHAGTQTEHFSSALLALMDGWRVGHAKEYFDERYMDMAVMLNEMQDRIQRWHEVIDPVELAAIWTACHDARNYLVLGDPAVRAT